MGLATVTVSDNSDFNNYTNQAIYMCGFDMRTMSNCPLGLSSSGRTYGILVVFNTGYIIQIFCDCYLTSTPGFRFRSKRDSVWSDWRAL